MTNRTARKIFIRFTLTATLIAMILLVINFLGVGFIGSDTARIYGSPPKRVLRSVAENLSSDSDGFALPDEIIPEQYWCILLNDSGDIIWSKNKPDDIPDHYSLQDVARMTRWFLNDYPVYVDVEDYGLLVLGIPKNSVGKYPVEYSMDWFDTLPRRILTVLLINLALATVLALLLGSGLYRRLRILTRGMNDLRRETPVHITEGGIFREIYQSINETSDTIGRKNAVLAARDSARANWISGISHDIRTPLSVITGYSEELAACGELSAENRAKAETITRQSVRIKKLVEDLNLISSLEYDMQPSKKKRISICPLLRRIVADIINNGISDKFEMELNLQNEKSTVQADESLLERAIFNLLNNSITHNPSGCKIRISQYEQNDTVYIDIEDDGRGVPGEVLDNLSRIPKSTHGMGLPMAYRIIHVHGGKFTAVNEDGLKIHLELPKS